LNAIRLADVTWCFFSAGTPLPNNWDKVVLDKKEIDKLHSRRIEYHQDRMRGAPDY